MGGCKLTLADIFSYAILRMPLLLLLVLKTAIHDYWLATYVLSLLILVDHLCAIIRDALKHVEVLILWIFCHCVEEDAEPSIPVCVLLLANIF